MCQSFFQKNVIFAHFRNKKKDENRPWSDDDYVSLTKLLSKYPGGTSNRWDRIANDLDRPVAEVIKKTKDAQKKMHTFNASGGNNRYSFGANELHRKIQINSLFRK